MRTLIADHPLVIHKLTLLRDARTDTATFRMLTDELVTLLAYEATREVRVQPVEVRTPVGQAQGVRLTGSTAFGAAGTRTRTVRTALSPTCSTSNS